MIPVTTEWVSWFREHPLRVWTLALVLYGGGDTATSIIGLRTNTVSEIGPLAHIAVETAGLGGFLLLKLGFCGLCFLMWVLLTTPGRVAIPGALIVAGAGVTGWNLIMLLI